MAKKKDNSLKIGQIREKAKSVNEWEVYDLDEQTTLKFQPIFSDSKITELLEDYQKLIKEAEEKEITLSDKMTYYLILLNAIRKFTHLGKDMKVNIEYQLEFLDAIVDSGYFKTITEEVFLPDQVSRIFDKVTDVISTSQAINDVMVQAQDKFQNLKLKNQDIFEEYAAKNKLKAENEVVN
jgi:hypothetical protein